MTKFYYPPSINGTQKTLGAQLLSGVTSAATFNNVVGIQNKAGIMVVDRVDTNDVETPSKREYISFEGTSGSTVTTLVRNVDGGGTDQDHAIGAIVEFVPNITEEQANIDNFLVEHADGGTHGTATVTTLKATAAVTNTGTSDLTIVTPLALKTAERTVTAYTPDAAGTATITLNTGNIHNITMPAGNITIAVSGETAGQCFLIEILQDATGSRTVTWFSTIKWVGGSAPTLTTTASKRDVFGFRVTGTDTYDGYVVGQNI